MSQLLLGVLLGVSFYFASAPAWGDLPSLMSDKPQNLAAVRVAPSDATPARLLGLESPLKGKLALYSLGDVDYRFNRGGVKASLKRGGTWFDTSIGYDGKRRLELNWRTGGGRLKFAVGAEDSQNGYRFEFTRNF